MTHPGPPILRALERYLDTVPRSAAEAEPLGPFTLFVRLAPGWRYYARPTVGSQAFRPGDVVAVFERQHTLGQPQSIEWVHETAPALATAAEQAGALVHRRPLMVLSGEPPATPVPEGFTLCLMQPDDPVLTAASAVPAVAFRHMEPVVGVEGIEALDAAARDTDPTDTAFLRDRMRSGLTVMVAAFHGGSPAAVGFHQPVDGVSEVVGVATLPAFRQRGLGAAITAHLAENSLHRYAHTVFLSAGDNRVARVYARVGFQTVATACEASPSATP